MNIALQRVMTVQEFLAWAEAQSERPHAELINGRIVPKYPEHALTVDEYLACGALQPERQRTELINGQIVPMTPERAEHVETKGAAFIALREAIARARLLCHAMSDGMTVRVDDFNSL